MITVKCPKCGDELLILPDVRAMVKVIKEHEAGGSKLIEDIILAMLELETETRRIKRWERRANK